MHAGSRAQVHIPEETVQSPSGALDRTRPGKSADRRTSCLSGALAWGPTPAPTLVTEASLFLGTELQGVDLRSTHSLPTDVGSTKSSNSKFLPGRGNTAWSVIKEAQTRYQEMGLLSRLGIMWEVGVG